MPVNIIHVALANPIMHTCTHNACGLVNPVSKQHSYSSAYLSLELVAASVGHRGLLGLHTQAHKVQF
jgi:hypothetical protein